MKRRRVLSARGAPALAAGLALVLSATTAQAAWVSGFSGHNEFTLPSSTADGMLSFAVYENTDGDWTNDFGAAFGAALTSLNSTIDAAATYVYFYQVVNTDPVAGLLDSDLGSLYISGAENYTSWGVASNVNDGGSNSFVFVDPSEGDVGPAGNEALGDEALDFQIGVAPNDFGENAGTAPTSYSAGVDITPDGTEVALQFSFQESSNDELDTAEYTAVLFATSNWKPVFDRAWLQDGQYTVDVAVAATPVPASLAMLLGGLPGFAGLGLVLRRKRETVAA